MKVEYINNTCDIAGLEDLGEYGIILYNGNPVFHVDYSDGFIDINDSVKVLKKVSIYTDGEFSVDSGSMKELPKVSAAQKKAIKKMISYGLGLIY